MTAAELAAALRADPSATLEALELVRFAGHRQRTPFAVSARLGVHQDWDRAVASVHYLGDGKGGRVEPETYIGYGPWPVATAVTRAGEAALRQRESFVGRDLDDVCDRTDAAWVAAGWCFPPPTQEEATARKVKAWIREVREEPPEVRAAIISDLEAKLTDERSDVQLNYRIVIAYLKAPPQE